MVVLWFSGSFMGQQQLKAAELSCHIFILFRFSNPFMPGQGVCCLCAAWIDAAPSHTGHNVLPEGEDLLEPPCCQHVLSCTFGILLFESLLACLSFLQWLFRGCDPVQLSLVCLQSSS